MYSFDEVLNYDPELAKAMDDELAISQCIIIHLYNN